MIVYGSLSAFSHSFADDLPVGKTYWIISSTEAQLKPFELSHLYDNINHEMGSAKWIKITGKSGSHYEMELPGGKRDIIRADWAESAVAKRILIDFDPQAKAKRDAAATNQARAKLISSKPWPAEIKSAVLNRKVLLGMTPEQVQMAIGKPKQINRSVYSFGVHEQWVYNNGTYLYFENDKMTSFQDSR